MFYDENVMQYWIIHNWVLGIHVFEWGQILAGEECRSTRSLGSFIALTLLRKCSATLE